MGKNDGVKVGSVVNDRTITKLELDIANRLDVDVRLVKEDTQNGTGVVMILSNLNSIKDFCSSHRSWSPSFFRIGVKVGDKQGSVSIAGSGYNKDAPATKGATSKNVL